MKIKKWCLKNIVIVIKKIPKTQRYKMLGNAVTVKVVEEISRKINLV